MRGSSAGFIAQRPALAALLAGSLLFTRTAQGETPAPPDQDAVVVFTPRCSAGAAPFGWFLDSLNVEMAGRRPWCCVLANSGHQARFSDRVRVELEIEPCEREMAHVVVRLSYPSRGFEAQHPVSLIDVAVAARPRALALAVAELIRAAESEAPVTEPSDGGRTATPPAAGVARLPPNPSLPAASVSLPRWSLQPALDMRHYLSSRTTLWGGRIATATNRRGLRIEIDVGAAGDRFQFATGKVSLCTANGGVAVSPRFVRGPLAYDLGVRAELGWAWVGGESTEDNVKARSGSSPIASLGVRLGLEAPAMRSVRVRLGLDGGITPLRLVARVDGSEAVAVSGAYLGLSLGTIFARR